MRSCLIRWTMSGLMAAAVLAGPAVTAALACPNCKSANETDNTRPRAYMYSILFMLGVPGTMATGIAVGLVVMGRREVSGLEDNGLSDDEQPT